MPTEITLREKGSTSTFTIRDMDLTDKEKTIGGDTKGVLAVHKKAFSSLYRKIPDIDYFLKRLKNADKNSENLFYYVAEAVKKGHEKIIGYIGGYHQPSRPMSQEYENPWKFGRPWSKESLPEVIKELDKNGKGIAPCVHISWFAVSPSERNRHVGQALFRHLLEQAARKFRGEAIELHVNPDHKKAFNFYQQNGFQEVLRNPLSAASWAPMNENYRSVVLMQKILPLYQRNLPLVRPLESSDISSLPDPPKPTKLEGETLPAHTEAYTEGVTFHREDIPHRFSHDVAGVFHPIPRKHGVSSIRQLTEGKFSFEEIPDFSVERFHPAKIGSKSDSELDEGFEFKIIKNGKIVKGEKCADFLEMLTPPQFLPSLTKRTRALQAKKIMEKSSKMLQNGAKTGSVFRLKVEGAPFQALHRCRWHSLIEISPGQAKISKRTRETENAENKADEQTNAMLQRKRHSRSQSEAACR